MALSFRFIVLASLVFALFASRVSSVDVSSGEPATAEVAGENAEPDEYVIFDNSFSCEGRTYGYYADVNNGCQVFHICYPHGENGRMLKYSLICNTDTIFDQQLLVCNNVRNAYPCEKAPDMYYINAEKFGAAPSPDKQEILEPEVTTEATAEQ